MELINKKVLVTGSEGFIGSHLVERLVEIGADVTAFVLYNSFNSWGWLDTIRPEIKSNIKIYLGDVRDEYSAKNAVKNKDVVLHLAALIAIPYSYQAPLSYIETNVKGTVNVLQACKEEAVEKLLLTSTSEVYGSARYIPIDENHPLSGQSPYSASKIGADAVGESFFRSFNTPVSIIRPFNTYGPRQSARAVIPTIITQILSGAKEIKLGNLTPTRDLNYVKDTVEGFVKIAQSEASIGEVINIGSGCEYSIGDVANMIIKLMNSNVCIACDDDRIRPNKSEVERLCANSSKAKSLTGWYSKYNLEEGLKETIEWMKENLKHYKADIYNV